MNDDSRPYIQALEQRIGISLSFDDSGAAFLHDGELGLLLQAGPGDEFLMHAEIGRPAPEALDPVLTELLAGNYFMLKTGGGALSFNPESGMAAINFRLSLDGLSPEAFADGVMEAAETAGYWKNRLSEANARQEHAGTNLQKPVYDVTRDFLQV